MLLFPIQCVPLVRFKKSIWPSGNKWHPPMDYISSLCPLVYRNIFKNYFNFILYISICRCLIKIFVCTKMGEYVHINTERTTQSANSAQLMMGGGRWAGLHHSYQHAGTDVSGVPVDTLLVVSLFLLGNYKVYSLRKKQHCLEQKMRKDIIICTLQKLLCFVWLCLFVSNPSVPAVCLHSVTNGWGWHWSEATHLSFVSTEIIILLSFSVLSSECIHLEWFLKEDGRWIPYHVGALTSADSWVTRRGAEGEPPRFQTVNHSDVTSAFIDDSAGKGQLSGS